MLGNLSGLGRSPPLAGRLPAADRAAVRLAAQRVADILPARGDRQVAGVCRPEAPIWLIVFIYRMGLTQGGIALGLFDVSLTRQLAADARLGALIGGLMFGVGMIWHAAAPRGCWCCRHRQPARAGDR